MKKRIQEFSRLKHAQLIMQFVPEAPPTFASHWIMLAAMATQHMIIANMLIHRHVRQVKSITVIMIMHLTVTNGF